MLLAGQSACCILIDRTVTSLLSQYYHVFSKSRLGVMDRVVCASKIVEHGITEHIIVSARPIQREGTNEQDGRCLLWKQRRRSDPP